MNVIGAINVFSRAHPDATLWIAIGLMLAACCLLLRLDQRERPDYEFPESPDAERHAELTRYLERHQPTPRRGHSLDDVRFAGVRVCSCGRIVAARVKCCPHGVRHSRSR